MSTQPVLQPGYTTAYGSNGITATVPDGMEPGDVLLFLQSGPAAIPRAPSSTAAEFDTRLNLARSIDSSATGQAPAGATALWKVWESGDPTSWVFPNATGIITGHRITGAHRTRPLDAMDSEATIVAAASPSASNPGFSSSSIFINSHPNMLFVGVATARLEETGITPSTGTPAGDQILTEVLDLTFDLDGPVFNGRQCVVSDRILRGSHRYDSVTYTGDSGVNQAWALISLGFRPDVGSPLIVGGTGFEAASTAVGGGDAFSSIVANRIGDNNDNPSRSGSQSWRRNASNGTQPTNISFSRKVVPYGNQDPDRVLFGFAVQLPVIPNARIMLANIGVSGSAGKYALYSDSGTLVLRNEPDAVEVRGDSIEAGEWVDICIMASFENDAFSYVANRTRWAVNGEEQESILKEAGAVSVLTTNATTLLFLGNTDTGPVAFDAYYDDVVVGVDPNDFPLSAYYFAAIVPTVLDVSNDGTSVFRTNAAAEPTAADVALIDDVPPITTTYLEQFAADATAFQKITAFQTPERPPHPDPSVVPVLDIVGYRFLTNRVTSIQHPMKFQFKFIEGGDTTEHGGKRTEAVPGEITTMPRPGFLVGTVWPSVYPWTPAMVAALEARFGFQSLADTAGQWWDLILEVGWRIPHPPKADQGWGILW